MAKKEYWVKVRLFTNHPKLIALHRALNSETHDGPPETRCTALGLAVQWFQTIRQYGYDADSLLHADDIDQAVNRPGFARAAARIGWLKGTKKSGYRIVDWEKWFGENVKTREKDRIRKQLRRDEMKQNVQRNSSGHPTDIPHRIEQSRSEEIRKQQSRIEEMTSSSSPAPAPTPTPTPPAWAAGVADNRAAAADSSAMRAANVADGDDAALNALKTALMCVGINEPKFSQLVALHPSLTATMVNAERERCRERGKGTGVMIMNLEQQAQGKRLKTAQTVSLRARSERDSSPEDNTPPITREQMRELKREHAMK